MLAAAFVLIVACSASDENDPGSRPTQRGAKADVAVDPTLSCEGACGDLVWDADGYCACDARCAGMGDCCSDFNTVCGGGEVVCGDNAAEADCVTAGCIWAECPPNATCDRPYICREAYSCDEYGTAEACAAGDCRWAECPPNATCDRPYICTEKPQCYEIEDACTAVGCSWAECPRNATCDRPYICQGD